MNEPNSKTRLRSLARSLLKPITLDYRKQASTLAKDLLFSSNLCTNIQHIGCYFAQYHEIDAMPIIQHLWNHEKYCYIPLVEANSKILKFGKYVPNSTLHFNKYNICEPKTNFMVNAQELDILILPMLGFDRQGTRLGSGAGFYDQTLGILDKSNYPVLIGLAYAQQEFPYIPRTKLDIPVDYILTETELFKCNLR